MALASASVKRSAPFDRVLPEVVLHIARFLAESSAASCAVCSGKKLQRIDKRHFQSLNEPSEKEGRLAYPQAGSMPVMNERQAASIFCYRVSDGA